MEISPQSKRLKEFINTTGMSITEFGKQCQIPSSSSLHNVIALGKPPSTKLLDKIILRFPQLNYDWVLLGYGEMIVKGLQNQPSVDSVQKSRDASYDNIQEYLQNHDYALNYLANKIEKALLSTRKTFQAVNDRMELWLLDRKIKIYWEKKQRETQQKQKIRESMNNYGVNYVPPQKQVNQDNEVPNTFLASIEQ